MIFCITVSGRDHQSVESVEPDLTAVLAAGGRLQQAGEFKAAIEQFQKALPLAEQRHDEQAIGEAAFGIGVPVATLTASVISLPNTISRRALT